MSEKNRSFQSKLHKAYCAYDGFMEKKGFYVVLAICVMVIIFSAVYTFQMREALENPAFPEEAQSVGGSQDAQRLSDVQALISSAPLSPTSSPAPKTFSLARPLDGALTRGFSTTQPLYFARVSAYRVHLGVDFESEYGALVKAGADGTVKSVGEEGELGLCVRISHQQGYETLYAGLSEALYVKTGDPVRALQTIGHVGEGVLYEADAAPHLHFEVTLNGDPIDPISLFLQNGVE